MKFERLARHLQSTVHFTNDDMEVLFPFIEPVVLKKKKFLFSQGEISRYVGFVNKGCLRYFFTDDKGIDHILYFAFEDWWIGDLNSFYMNEPSPNCLQALEDSELFYSVFLHLKLQKKQFLRSKSLLLLSIVRLIQAPSKEVLNRGRHLLRKNI